MQVETGVEKYRSLLGQCSILASGAKLLVLHAQILGMSREQPVGHLLSLLKLYLDSSCSEPTRVLCPFEAKYKELCQDVCQALCVQPL